MAYLTDLFVKLSCLFESIELLIGLVFFFCPLFFFCCCCTDEKLDSLLMIIIKSARFLLHCFFISNPAQPEFTL